jgi:2-polyprenyl-3-methyl-5-hydroxy-6-metoxy-1,4-benzoquinol methylase
VQVDIELGKAAAFQRQGNFAEAVKIFQAVLKTAPKTPIAHYNLALIYKAERKTSAAEKAFKTALKLDAKYTLAWQAYVYFLSDRGKIKEAIRAAIIGAKAQNFSTTSKQLIADQMKLASSVKLGSTGKEALLICLGDNSLEFEGAVYVATEYLENHPIFSKFFTVDNDLSILENYFQKNSKSIVDALFDPLLIKIFSYLIVPTSNFENGIHNLRYFLSNKSPSIPLQKMIEARALIGLQMELREYSAPSSSESINFRSDLDILSIASMYEPIPFQTASAALKEQVKELKRLPLMERLCKKFASNDQSVSESSEQLATLAKVKDETSLRVQSQYEESPYPRWFGLRKTGTQTLQSLVSRLYPHLNTHKIVQAPRILVAGCGTGRHALRTAVRIKNSQVFAIDLSKNSLAYAKMKALELDISNVEFAQADINELSDEIGEFDLIECCGVLHHMADPERAWRHLSSFLNTNGFMKIALYSKLARQDVFAARKYLNIDPENLTLEDIRNARQQIFNLPEEHPAKSVSKDLDFYSIGGCRDFLFHRQETCYSLDEIKSLLEKLNLEFLGFEFADVAILNKYQKLFPLDPNALNLDNWQSLEETNPMLFRGMYQFWCRPFQA